MCLIPKISYYFKNLNNKKELETSTRIDTCKEGTGLQLRDVRTMGHECHEDIVTSSKIAIMPRQGRP